MTEAPSGSGRYEDDVWQFLDNCESENQQKGDAANSPNNSINCLPSYYFKSELPPSQVYTSPQSLLPSRTLNTSPLFERAHDPIFSNCAPLHTSQVLSGNLGSSTPKKIIDRSRFIPDQLDLDDLSLLQDPYKIERHNNFYSLNNEIMLKLKDYLDTATTRDSSPEHSINSIQTDLMGEPAPEFPEESRNHSPYFMPYHEVAAIFKQLYLSQHAQKEFSIKEQELNSNISKSNAEISTLQASLTKESLSRKEVLLENDSLRSTLVERERDLIDKENELNKLYTTSRALEDENQELCSRVSSLEFEMINKTSNLEKQVESLKAELDHCQTDLKLLTDDNASLNSQQKSWAEERLRLINENNNIALSLTSIKHSTAAAVQLQDQLRSRFNSKDIIISIDEALQELDQLNKDRRFLEIENAELRERLENVSSQKENELRDIISKTVHKPQLQKSTELESDIISLNAYVGELGQKHSVLQNKIKELEIKIKKSTEQHDQLLSQEKSISSKANELQISYNQNKEAVQKLISAKSELTKKRRALEMEVGGLESSIINISKSINRSIPSRKKKLPSAPIFKSPSHVKSLSENQDTCLVRPLSSLSNPYAKSDLSNQNNENNLNSSFFATITIPSLSFLDHSSSSVRKDNNMVDELYEQKLEQSKRRIADLEAMVKALSKNVDQFGHELEAHSSILSCPVPFSDRVEEDPNCQRVDQLVQGTYVALEKIDDLCRLLCNNTDEFNNLISAEHKIYSLQLEKEALQLKLQEMANQISCLEHKSKEIDSKEAKIRNSELEADYYSNELATLEKSNLEFKEKCRVLKLQNQDFAQTQEFLNNRLKLSFQTIEFLEQDGIQLRNSLSQSETYLQEAQEKFDIERKHGLTHRQTIQRLEDQLKKLRYQFSNVGVASGFPSPQSLSPTKDYSRRSSECSSTFFPLASPSTSWEELSRILSYLRAAHQEQHNIIIDFHNGEPWSKCEARLSDLQHELRNLDLQANRILSQGINKHFNPKPLIPWNDTQLVPNDMSYTSTTTDQHLSFDTSPKKYIYTKPYKELCYRYRAEYRYLKNCFARESNLRADLIFQKQYLQMLIGGHEAGEDACISFISSMGFGAATPAKAQQKSSLPLVFNSCLSLSARRLTPNHTSALSESRQKLRRCVWAVVAINRVKLMASDWLKACEDYNHQRDLFNSSLSK